jgi:hypothetical protein
MGKNYSIDQQPTVKLSRCSHFPHGSAMASEAEVRYNAKF